MIRGLYTAASGMMAELTRADVTANNLANVNTAGYKKDVALAGEFGEVLIQRVNDGGSPVPIGSIGTGVQIDNIVVNQAAGPVKFTGSDLDMAIEGQGFFTVRTPAGIRYTRNGTFSKNGRGELVTGDGFPVMGQNGPVRITGAKLTVDEQGRVLQDGIQTDRLQIVSFSDERQLVKEGATLFNNAGGAAVRPAAGQVRQGYLEQANVNIIGEMVNLINGYRSYEINGKAVKANDGVLDKAVNEVGKLS